LAKGLLDEFGSAVVIGGAEIYQLALPHCKRAYVTRVEGDYRGDVFFPGRICRPEWALAGLEYSWPDDRNPVGMWFETWERK
jgi:dihydrofolate reductase